MVVQKSVREGFGLTVTEGMWKGRPVVASPVGGIRTQVLDGQTGLAALADRAVADAIIRLLRDLALAGSLSRAGKEHVRRSFILPVYLKRWLDMLSAERSRQN